MAKFNDYKTPFDLGQAYPLAGLGNLLQTPQPVNFMDTMAADTQRLQQEVALEQAQRKEDFASSLQENPNLSLDEIEKKALESGLLGESLLVGEAQRQDMQATTNLSREQRQLREIEEKLKQPLFKNSGSDIVAIDKTTGKVTTIHQGKAKESKPKQDTAEIWYDPNGFAVAKPKSLSVEETDALLNAGYQKASQVKGNVISELEMQKKAQAAQKAGITRDTIPNSALKAKLVENKEDSSLEENRPKNKLVLKAKD